MIMGAVTLTSVLLYSNFIKTGSYYLLKPGSNEESDLIDRRNQLETFKQKIGRGLSELKRNGWLLVSLIINTLARADLYLITTVFALWMKSYYTADSSESEEGGEDD